MNQNKVALETISGGRSATLCVREWRLAKPLGTVICLHGLGVTGAEYAPMAEGLNAAGFDAIAPDWIGHGDSEYLGDPAGYGWDGYLKCLTAVFRRYHKPPTHYVGASWGAALLLIFLLAQRVKPHSSTFADVPLKSSPLLATQRKVIREQSTMTFRSIAEANAFLAEQRPEFAKVPERFKDYFDDERFSSRGDEVRVKFDPAILPAFAATSSATFNYVDVLQRIAFNALFLYGHKSPYRLPFEFMAACAKHPHIRYRDDMPGGHPPTLLHEEQFRPIIEFIEQTNARR